MGATGLFEEKVSCGDREPIWMHKTWRYTDLKHPPRRDDERCPTKDVEDKELLAFFQMALEAYVLPDWLPVPPSNLPGRSVGEKHNDQAMWIIRQGARYLCAYMNGERRTLWNVHDDIMSKLQEAYDAGKAKGEEEATKMFIAAVPHQSEYDPTAGYVYFIRSDAGPIKIGKANDPESRLRALQTSHFAKLDIAATCEGGLCQRVEIPQTLCRTPS